MTNKPLINPEEVRTLLKEYKDVADKLTRQNMYNTGLSETKIELNLKINDLKGKLAKKNEEKHHITMGQLSKTEQDELEAETILNQDIEYYHIPKEPIMAEIYDEKNRAFLDNPLIDAVILSYKYYHQLQEEAYTVSPDILELKTIYGLKIIQQKEPAIKLIESKDLEVKITNSELTILKELKKEIQVADISLAMEGHGEYFNGPRSRKAVAINLIQELGYDYHYEWIENERNIYFTKEGVRIDIGD